MLQSSKHIYILFFCLCSFTIAKGQSYFDAIKQADKEFNAGHYKDAIDFYFAAAAIMPENKGEVKEKVKMVYDKIDALRKIAVDALAEAKKQTALAIKAQKDAEEQKEIAQKALKQNIEFQEKAVGKKYKGGIIFYSDSARKHGLIAAEMDFDSTYTWDEAKNICANYSVTADGITYDDWFLPSKDTLSLLNQSKSTIGGFKNENYWTSSEDKTNVGFFWVLNFGNGYQDNIFGRPLSFRVRAVRVF